MPSLAAAGAQALLLSIAVALPVLGVAAVVGLIVAALSAATQIQDPTVSHLPRLLGVAAALLVFAPWMGYQIAEFARQMFAMAAL